MVSIDLPKHNVIHNISEISGRIGLFGGTFDPPHFGHLELATKAIEHFDLDHLLFIPTSANPLKGHLPAPGHDRLQMLELLISGLNRCKILTTELRNVEPSSTVETLLILLKEKKLDASLIFILGIDAFATFHTWKGAECIPDMVELGLVFRGELPVLEEVSNILGERFVMQLLEKRMSLNSNLSSSEIRKRQGMNETLENLIPPLLNKYIREHELYL